MLGRRDEVAGRVMTMRSPIWWLHDRRGFRPAPDQSHRDEVNEISPEALESADVAKRYRKPWGSADDIQENAVGAAFHFDNPDVGVELDLATQTRFGFGSLDRRVFV